MRNLILIAFSLFILGGCSSNEKNPITPIKGRSYFDYSNSDDQATGGVKMIPIETSKGTFNVYTKRMGNNPKIRV